MNVYPMRSLRTAEWKYIRNLHPDFQFTTHIDLAHKNEKRPGAWGVYWDSWLPVAKTNTAAAKIIKAYHQRPAEELYYLPNDPHEQRNLATDSKHARELRTFRTQLETWMDEQGDRRTVYGKARPIPTTDPEEKD